MQKVCLGFRWIHGLTTTNASPIEIRVKCLNPKGLFYFFLLSTLSIVAYHNKAFTVFFSKTVPIWVCYPYAPMCVKKAP